MLYDRISAIAALHSIKYLLSFIILLAGVVHEIGEQRGSKVKDGDKIGDSLMIYYSSW